MNSVIHVDVSVRCGCLPYSPNSSIVSVVSVFVCPLCQRVCAITRTYGRWQCGGWVCACM